MLLHRQHQKKKQLLKMILHKKETHKLGLGEKKEVDLTKTEAVLNEDSADERDTDGGSGETNEFDLTAI